MKRALGRQASSTSTQVASVVVAVVGAALLGSACEVQDLEILSSLGDGGGRDAGRSDGGAPDGGEPLDAGTPSVEPSTLVAASYTHTCAIFAGGILECWGAGDRGQLGVAVASAPRPVRVPLDVRVASVALGARSTCVLGEDGGVRCVGAGDRGQLGRGDAEDGASFAAVALPAAARRLASGDAHVCALLVDDHLHCWGRNDEGQLGIEPIDVSDQRLPRLVATGSSWEHVSAGQGHTLAITRQGILHGWGRNSDDQLGLGPEAPIQRRTPTQIGDQSWSAVAAGQSHSCAITADRVVACFGNNGSAQLGLGDFTDRDVPTLLALEDADAVATNTFHGCAIRRGELYCWGRNVEGQLGTGDVDDRELPTRIGADDDWTHVATGRFHTCARKRDGRVFCTGANESGQLGVGDTERRRALTLVTPDLP